MVWKDVVNDGSYRSAFSVVLSKKSALYAPTTESLILIKMSCNVHVILSILW